MGKALTSVDTRCEMEATLHGREGGKAPCVKRVSVQPEKYAPREEFEYIG